MIVLVLPPQERSAYCSASDDDWLRLDSEMATTAIHMDDDLRFARRNNLTRRFQRYTCKRAGELQKACYDLQAAMNRLGGPGFDGFSLAFYILMTI